MLKNKHQNREGLALPLVLAFVICVMVLATSLVFFRKESKQQNLTNVHFLQANFLAQSAIQMMMLKLSAFPQEAADAGVLSLGYCPFRGIIAGSGIAESPANANPLGLEQFFADCNTASFPWKIPLANVGDWKCGVTEFKVISVYTNPAERQLVISAQTKAVGEAKMQRGGMDIRKEEMIKTVKLTRQN